MANDYGEKEIEASKSKAFELWPCEYPGTWIHLEHPEFTSICPRSGYPDFGTIVIDYIPDKYVVELKAFKLYINSFRNERISHENVINVIADKIFNESKPTSLRIIGDFTRRGGVKMTATVYRGKDQDNWPEYKMNPL